MTAKKKEAQGKANSGIGEGDKNKLGFMGVSFKTVTKIPVRNKIGEEVRQEAERQADEGLREDLS